MTEALILLIQKHDSEKIRRLVSTNWIRTILWSLKSVIGFMLLLEILSRSFGFNFLTIG